jgi:hypothetical protein
VFKGARYKDKFTPPSPMKATPNTIASNTNDVCPMSVSNADDITVTSSSQNKELHINYSTPTSKDPPEGETMAVIAVIRVMRMDNIPGRAYLSSMVDSPKKISR